MTEPTPTRGDILADAFRSIASAAQRAAASTRDDFALAPPPEDTGMTHRTDAEASIIAVRCPGAGDRDCRCGAGGPRAGRHDPRRRDRGDEAMTDPTPTRDYIRRQAERFRESQRQVEEFIHRNALTPRQDAPVWPLETLSGAIAGMESPEGVTGVQEGTRRLTRMTADTATDDGLDALYAELADLRAEVEHWRSGGGDRYDTFVPWTVCEAMHHQLEQKVAAVAAELDAIDGDVHGKDPVALAGLRTATHRIRAVLNPQENQ